jgi:hypothetical protein
MQLQAAGYTGAIVGSMAWVGANAPTDQYLWLAAPLSMGLGAVVVASLVRVPPLYRLLLHCVCSGRPVVLMGSGAVDAGSRPSVGPS